MNLKILFERHTGEKAGYTEKPVNRNFIIKLEFKIIGCVICVSSIIMLVVGYVDEALYDAYSETDAYRLSDLEDDYASKRYDDMYSTMHLYELNGETYEKYTEICEAYNDYLLADAYMQSEINGTEENLITENKANEYRDNLENAIKKSRYPTNQKQMQKWLDELDSLGPGEEQTEIVVD